MSRKQTRYTILFSSLKAYAEELHFLKDVPSGSLYWHLTPDVGGDGWGEANEMSTHDDCCASGPSAAFPVIPFLVFISSFFH